MNLLRQHIPADCNIFIGGDKHGGALSSHKKGFLKLCDALESECDGIQPENNFYIDMGDVIESITLDDKRFDPQNCTDYSPIVQVQEAVTDYTPIKNHIICMLDGNHPRKLWRVVPNLTGHICQLLDVPYGDYTAKITMIGKDGNTAFKVYATHGRKTINSNLADPAQAWASKQRALKNALRELAGDCIIMAMGHSHQLVHVEPHNRLYIYDTGDDIEQGYVTPQPDAQFIHPDQRWYINSGSFLRTQMVGHSTYAEIAQYAPVELGYYKIEIRDYKPVSVERVCV